MKFSRKYLKNNSDKLRFTQTKILNNVSLQQTAIQITKYVYLSNYILTVLFEIELL